MTNQPPAFLQDVTPTTPSEHSLAAMRAKVAEARDLKAEIADLKARLAEKEGALTKLETVTLVDMLTSAGLDKMGVDAEGNMPAYDAEIEDVVRANIAAAWPEDKKQAAYSLLEQHKAGSLIKTTVTFEFEREDRATAKEFLAKAEELGYLGEEKLSVHSGTLGAWLRAEIKAGRMPTKTMLDALGGYVGKVVKIKPRRAK